MRLWRAVRAAVPWCLLVLGMGLLLAIEGRWGTLGQPTMLPSSGAQYEQAWHPYRQVDPGGAWSVCISSRSGKILPPYIAPDDPTPAPALASNPPINQAL